MLGTVSALRRVALVCAGIAVFGCTAKIVPFVPPCDAGECASADGGAVDVAVPRRDAVLVSVRTLRDPGDPAHPAEGTFVRVEGAIVTAVKSAGQNHGFYIQDANGGAYGGVFVFIAAKAVDVVPGAVVNVTGAYKVFRELDEIDVQPAGATYEQTGAATVPVPVEATATDLSTSPRAAELESMLVRVRNVTVATAPLGTDFVVTQSGSTTQLVVTSFVANDVGASFAVRPGDAFREIVGMGYVTGPEGGPYTTKLAPRSEADLIK
jgi:predicted extracellular nuclease